jgi:hypothetical protein
MVVVILCNWGRTIHGQFVNKGVPPYDRRTSFAERLVAFRRTAMNPVDALVKSLALEQSVAWLFAGACFLGGGILALAVQLNLLRPLAGQFVPLCAVAGLIGASHGFVAIRLQTLVKTLAALSKAPTAPASLR